MYHIFVNIAKHGVANIIVCRMRNLTNMLHFGVVAMVVVAGNELGKYRRRQICTKRNPDKIPGKILLSIGKQIEEHSYLKIIFPAF